jgi:drug/metabolite transporter (DMT)-like permease
VKDADETCFLDLKNTLSFVVRTAGINPILEPGWQLRVGLGQLHIFSMTLIIWSVTCVLWSTVWVFIKFGVADVPPITFAAYRLFVALLVLVPILAARRVALPRDRRDWVLIGGTGVLLLGVNYALLYWGMQYVSSGLAAVLQALTPVFAMVFAHVLLIHERISPIKVAALAVGIVGVAVIFVDQLRFAGWPSLLGSSAVLAGAMFVAVAYVLMKKHGRELHPSIITAGQMFAALLPLSALAFIVDGNPLAIRWTTRAAVALLYLAVFGSITGMWLNYWLLKRMDATKVLVMALAEPPIAMMLGAAILDETLSARMIGGTICILVSVGVVLELAPYRRRA